MRKFVSEKVRVISIANSFFIQRVLGRSKRRGSTKRQARVGMLECGTSRCAIGVMYGSMRVNRLLNFFASLQMDCDILKASKVKMRREEGRNEGWGKRNAVDEVRQLNPRTNNINLIKSLNIKSHALFPCNSSGRWSWKWHDDCCFGPKGTNARSKIRPLCETNGMCTYRSTGVFSAIARSFRSPRMQRRRERIVFICRKTFGHVMGCCIEIIVPEI
jgi:hypothetical protein